MADRQHCLVQDDVELEINTDEFRIKATRELTVRQNMAPEDREKIEAVRKSLEPYLKCSHCHQIMLEPWIVKDCGHLFCYNCLDFLVERKVRLRICISRLVRAHASPRLCALAQQYRVYQ